MVSTEVLIIDALVVVISVAALGYMVYDIMQNKVDFKVQMKVGGRSKTVKAAGWTAFCLFWDGIGIGSYAPLTAGFKNLKIIRDKYIPGTLQVCTVAYQMVSALIFITNVEVDTLTLVACIVASSVGAFLGGGLVSRLNLDKTRIAVGLAMIVVAAVMIGQLTGYLGEQTGDAIGLSGWKLIVITVISFVFGALMTIGIGIYAPLMCTVAVMGMDVSTAFPIMMGSCAFLIPVAAISFIRQSVHAEKPQYDRKTAVIACFAGTAGGALGCYVILNLIDNFDLTYIKWLVVCVVIIVSIQMLYQGIKKKKDSLADEEDEEFDRLKAEYLAAHPEEA